MTEINYSRTTCILQFPSRVLEFNTSAHWSEAVCPLFFQDMKLLDYDILSIMQTKGDTTSYPVDRQTQTIEQEQGSQSGETVRWPAAIQTTLGEGRRH
jgi:hypothetical protein